MVKSPDGNTFNEIYNNMNKKAEKGGENRLFLLLVKLQAGLCSYDCLWQVMSYDTLRVVMIA